MIPALKSSTSTTLSLTSSIAEAERDSRMTTCREQVLKVAIAARRTDKLQPWLALCVKLFVDGEQEIVAANVHAFILGLAAESGETFCKRCTQPGTNKPQR
jgi:hypothetical protein